MKLYYPPEHYNASYRRQVFPLLKPFIKDANFTDVQRIKGYGVSARNFIIVEAIGDAEVVILPMSWNYYANTKQLALAYAFIEKAQGLGKPIWSINNGDFGVKLPPIKNLKVFRQSGYISNKQQGHVGFPSIIEDYLTKNKLNKTYLNIDYSAQPIVGFCGLAIDSKKNAILEVAKQVYRNLRSYLRFNSHEPQEILSTSYLRASLLKRLEINAAIDSRFIKRLKYRAGVTKNKETDSTTADFYNNILDSQYVLCVRGAGNFSVRFYETLMMGRIPLYVHTDGYLPLSDIIDWKDHVVWVDYKDRRNISQILLDFHQQLDPDALSALFKKNRKLWREKLTLSGFFEAQEVNI
ncbi:exostosin family protein [Winogradskyella epiphytica]|uniref:Exostosin family protein n=1 Tax=Winogradskyella epiphytica TaxID=262005 RepID=A0A2V4WY03_9FLAO|nr:exostosin family protein [Winogradskyella epiphytica]PYE82130.1 exostosin family protein [Winogradskyella epiphytica]GGW60329.1 hypothetical protein GCM10008085_09660 [Winogradskyella epiphytica]